MSDRFGVVRTVAALGTAPYAQDITSSDLEGENATWAIIIVSGTTADGSTTAHARLAVGFMAADGSEGCVSHKSRDNVAPQAHLSYGSGANGIVITNTAAGNTSAGTANFDSAIAGGIRISWSVAADSAYEMTVLLGSGSANAVVGTATGTSASVTTGFLADFVVTRCLDGTVGGSPFSANSDVSPGMGFAVRKPALAQAAIYGEWLTGANPTSSDAIVSDSNFTGTVQAGADNGVFITAFTATGWSQDQVAGSADFLYLAVQFSDVRYYGIAIENLPSGTGSASFTGLGFRPKVALQVSNLMVTGDGLDTVVSGAHGATYSVGAFSSSVQGSASESFQSGLTTGGGVNSDANSRSEAKPLTLLNHTAGLAAEATHTSMLDTGFQWSFSSATAGWMVVFAIGYPPTTQETVGITDASLMVVSAMQANETVGILEAQQFVSTAVLGETVGILDSEAFVSSLVSGEVVGILEGSVLTAADVAFILAQQRGRTAEGGPLKGRTTEGGPERASTR